MLQNKKYLFVGGCPRSGTTRISFIIGAHPEIILGIERYNNILHKKQFSLTQEHFSNSRFMKVERNDTFYQDFLNFKRHLHIPSKWDHAKYIGVKYPIIDEIIDELNHSIGQITVLYIYRDVFDVAESWNRRAEIGNNWPKTKRYKDAVIKWNESLSSIKDFILKGENIICINFNDLLFSEKPIDEIFNKLGLEISDEVEMELQYARSISNGKKEKKGKLSDTEYQYINSHAKHKLFDEFNMKYNILR
ncbi:MAG: hypothetical protein GQ527_08980 [Bacteroidales bacterium]|nr:hypothetical protein [Bacteroidales bacterium]